MKTQLPYYWLIILLFSSSIVFAQTNYPSFSFVSPGIGAPGDSFTPSFHGSVSSNAPQIAEWTRTAGPDQSIILTGYQLSRFSGTEEGKDIRFTLYGNDGIKRMAKVQRIDQDKAIITLDKDLPQWSMYLIWPGNDAGNGTPVAVNKTEAWWVGPDKAARGDTVAVFGRNLAKNNDTVTSHVYIKPAGGGAGQWAKVVKVNPYKVQFIVPPDFTNGEYEVWVHNGHGGQYGN
jgi:hypothetical protein